MVRSMLRRRMTVLALVACVPSALLAACGSRTGLLAPEPEEAGPDVRHDTAHERDVVPDVPPLDASKKDANKSDCPDADSTLVYVVAVDSELLSFYPPDASFKTIGLLTCPASGASPFSMAVDRKGVAYVEYDNGLVFEVSTVDASCTPTSFQNTQGSFTTFGMGYATIGVGPAEALYLASEDGHLGTLDTTSFLVTNVGAFQPNIQSAELTGTGDGRLYAYYASGNAGGSAIAEIDKTSGKLLGADTLDGVDRGDAWAFAFWGGDFWVFTAPNSQQTTVRYDPTSKTSSVVAHYSARIVGAGVSTCAPQ